MNPANEQTGAPPQTQADNEPVPPKSEPPRAVLATQAHGGEIRDDQLINGQNKNGSNDAKKESHGGHGHGDEDNVIPDDLPKPSRKMIFGLVGAFVILLIALFLIGLIPGWMKASEVRSDAQQRASDAPIVSTTQPITSAASHDVVLPCDVRAYSDTMLYPRANGYLKKWYFDIQSRVKAGDVLAEIDTPDVDAQLNESRATLKQDQAAVETAQSNLNLAQTTLNRYQEANRTQKGSVTEEDLDTRIATRDQAAAAVKQSQANVGAAEADVQRMEVMVSFEKIVAPFDGVITFRGYDVGALLSPSMASPGQEIFRIQQTDPLRVFVSVPQSYSSQMTVGQPAFLKVRNYGEREFTGYIARSAAAVDPSTRTMAYEVDFPNKDNALYPGMYATARLPITQTTPAVTVPSSALVFNADGTQVAVVKDNKVHFQKITVGRDLGTQLEVISGLSNDDQVVTNPGERLVDGVEVEVAKKPAPAGDQSKPQGEKVATKS